jgi:hypothetical protein
MLSEAAGQWAPFAEAVDEVLEVPISSGFASGIHGSDVSDPTSSAALASSRLYWSTKKSDVEAQAVEVHAAVKVLLAMMSARPVLQVDPQMKRLARCSDPVCEELAVAKGLCGRHWKAARRATLKTEATA